MLSVRFLLTWLFLSDPCSGIPVFAPDHTLFCHDQIYILIIRSHRDLPEDLELIGQRDRHMTGMLFQIPVIESAAFSQTGTGFHKSHSRDQDRRRPEDF